MLTVYSDLNKVDKKNFIKVNDYAFNLRGHIPDTDFAKEILKDIEKGGYYDDSSFISRTGKLLPKEALSSGTKTLFNILNNPTVCVSLLECGYNALHKLNKIKDGVVYWPVPALCMLDDNTPVYYADENKHFETIDSFLDYIDSLYGGDEDVDLSDFSW